jgi:hypothetical protein
MNRVEAMPVNPQPVISFSGVWNRLGQDSSWQEIPRLCPEMRGFK